MSVSCTVSVSWLNLHLYIKQRDVRKLIYSLLDECDRLMVEKAHLKNTHLPQIKIARMFAYRGYTNLLEHFSGNIMISYMTIVDAVSGGHLETFKWLKMRWTPNVVIFKQLCADATKHDQFHVFKYIFKYCIDKSARLDLVAWIVDVSVEYGRVRFLEYLHSAMLLDGLALGWEAAGVFGHLNVLQWAFEHGYAINYEKVRGSATRNGHTDIVVWVDETRNRIVEEQLNKTSGRVLL